jgi:hypothetical protein
VPEAAKHLDEISGTLLKGYPLGESAMNYYRLSAQAAKLAGKPELTGALEGIELREAIGRLSFCLLDEQARPLLAREELAERFPNVEWESYYYLDTDESGEKILGHVLVDHGTRWKRLWRVIRDTVIPEAAQKQGVKELLREDKFVIGLSTDNQKKIDAIDGCVEELKEGRVRLYWSPELQAVTTDKAVAAH